MSQTNQAEPLCYVPAKLYSLCRSSLCHTAISLFHCSVSLCHTATLLFHCPRSLCHTVMSLFHCPSSLCHTVVSSFHYPSSLCHTAMSLLHCCRCHPGLVDSEPQEAEGEGSEGNSLRLGRTVSRLYRKERICCNGRKTPTQIRTRGSSKARKIRVVMLFSANNLGHLYDTLSSSFIPSHTVKFYYNKF